MNKKLTVVGTATAALALTITMSSPAQAANTAYRLCNTVGAQGGITVTNWHGPDATVGLSISVSDLSSDNHQVRVRFISKDVRGAIKYWPWHSNNDGSGTTKSWTTTAQDGGGLFDVGVQVGRFAGNTMVNNCSTWR